ncbi:UNVERIFIED_CONTAM: hypothetical protein GTU68_041055 [Idotea baltica]|nr:hypothetical protein [Idotea baltica]
MRIVFMGTPDFAVPTLKELVDNGYDVVGVITATDKERGRGKTVQPSPVKKYALENSLNVLQPKNLKAPDFQAELKALNADLQVVVAFRMLPASVFEMPPKGTINLHSSLLPEYRGAAPINWAVINGETETGLTTFFIEQKIDTGELLFQHKMEIGWDETAGELHDRMMNAGGKLVLKTVKAIEVGNYKTTPQPQAETKPAPKIFKEDCEIDWNNPTRNIFDFIRGLSPYPAAFTVLKGNRFKVFKSKMEMNNNTPEAGTLKTDNKTFIKVATQDGWLHLIDLQLAGKKRMRVEDLLRGFSFD